MAIDSASGVSAVTVDDLLKQGLKIPNYQRPYSWEVSTALQLVDDLSEALRDTERKDVPYVLGAIILHKDGESLNVVDGQQRLLTLRMIIAALDPINHPISVSGNRENPNNPVSLVWVELQRRLSQLEDKDKENFLEFIRHNCQLVRIVTDDIDGDGDADIIYADKAGNRIAGPAIVMEMDSTTVIFPGFDARVDHVGNLLINPVSASKE